MKFIIIAFMALFLMLADLDGQWEVVINDSHSFYTPPSRWGYGFSDVYFINQTKGFMIGSSSFTHKGTSYCSFVYGTNDGGKTWNNVLSGFLY